MKLAEINGITVVKARGRKKTIVTAIGMRIKPSSLTKDDYGLPESMENYHCVICEERVGYCCSLCGCTLDFPDEQVSCGIGHICYDCWDELKENPNNKED